MKILIIEDSELKRKDIERFLKENFPDADVTTAASYSSGLRKAYKGEFDVVILDNSLPYYEDRPYDIQPDMARNILEEIEEILPQKRPRCIICSQYDGNTKEDYFRHITEQYDCCIGYIQYDNCSSDWEEKLKIMIRDNS